MNRKREKTKGCAIMRSVVVQAKKIMRVGQKIGLFGGKYREPVSNVIFHGLGPIPKIERIFNKKNK